MPDISVAQGEIEEIAEETNRGQNYQVRVENSDVRISDVRKYADEGVIISSGFDAIVRAPPDTRLWATAPNGNATLEITQGATNDLTNDEHPEIEIFPSGQVQVSGTIDADIQSWNAGAIGVDVNSWGPTPLDVDPGNVTIGSWTAGALDITDRSAREIGKARVQDSSGTLVDPATETTASSVLSALSNEGNLSYGEDTVATSGTAEPLNTGTSQAVPDGKSLLIRALDANTGKVYVGDSNVGTGNGYPLESGETVSLGVTDVADVFVDVDTGGEGVRWVVEVA